MGTWGRERYLKKGQRACESEGGRGGLCADLSESQAGEGERARRPSPQRGLESHGWHTGTQGTLWHTESSEGGQ